jgi:hypothetical protein
MQQLKSITNEECEGKIIELEAVRVSEKILLSVNEANAISGIGINKIREIISDPRCPFVFYVGKKHMIKRKAFEKYIDENIEI